LKYKLVYTQRAIKDIQKLEPKVKQRIGKTLLRYEDNPLNYSEKLIDPKPL
jgi:mRNA interferase RelE/StbE